MTTYTKLKTGAWGLRVVGLKVGVGDSVTVSKKDGSRKTETVSAVLWSGDGVTLCAIAPSAPSAAAGSVRSGLPVPAARPVVRKYRKGQDCPCCGSEPLDAQLHCWECGFSGK